MHDILNKVINTDKYNKPPLRDEKETIMNERYIKTVKFFIAESLNRKFWNSNKNLNQTLEKELKVGYKKRLSPYKRIFLRPR